MKIGLILLAILKGLGIVLLALLLLVLLLVLVVLLSPIRYRLQGEKQETLSGSFDVSYLWGAIRAEGSYTPEGQKLRVKVLWFTPIGGEEKPKKSKKAKKPKKAAQPKAEPAAKQPNPAPQPDLQAAEKTQPKPEPPKPAQPKPKPPTPQRMAEKQPKTVRRVKLSAIEEKPPTEEISLEDDTFFTGEASSVENTKKNGKLPPIVQELWHLEQKKEIFHAAAKLLKRLLKGILPGNLFCKATLGTGEPATTGYLLGLAGILTAKFGNDIQIKGDFTKATAEEIEVRVKGRIVLGQLLFAVLAFVLTKPVRKALCKIITFLRKKDAA